MDDSGTDERVSRVLKNKWRLDRLIGRGGMGAVYEATHRNGMRAAVKLLRRELSHNDELRARFLREGYLANSVEHPGVVRVFDDDVDDDGSVFLVMELLIGETLEAARAREGGRMGVADAVRIGAAVLDILASAHAKNMVHRDIKPDNVFLTRDGAVKLLDFGIARVREAQLSATQTGALLGTPTYMAPEHARGRWDLVDGRTDVWSVGATLFTTLSGRFVHPSQTGPEALVAAITTPAQPLGEVVPGLPLDVCRVIDRALAFDQAARWPSAAAMRDALLACTRGTSEAMATWAAPATESGRLLAAEAAQPPAPTDAEARSAGGSSTGGTTGSLSRSTTGVGDVAGELDVVPTSTGYRTAAAFVAGLLAVLGVAAALMWPRDKAPLPTSATGAPATGAPAIAAPAPSGAAPAGTPPTPSGSAPAPTAPTAVAPAVPPAAPAAGDPAAATDPHRSAAEAKAGSLRGKPGAAPVGGARRLPTLGPDPFVSDGKKAQPPGAREPTRSPAPSEAVPFDIHESRR